VTERFHGGVLRAERHALEIEMSERAGDRGDRKTPGLETIALKKRRSPNVAHLKFVTFMASESPLQLPG
jgi:hypothetical protein